MKILIPLSGLLLVFTTTAGKVRTLSINDNKMHPVFLRPHYSTVLRFEDKPEKIVMGNQSFFNIEFIEKDLTVRPLGIASTNLFVYTKKQNYGFLIHSSYRKKYDSLVKIFFHLPKFKRIRPQVILTGKAKGTVKRVGELGYQRYFVDIRIKKEPKKLKISSHKRPLKIVWKNSRNLRVFFSAKKNERVVLYTAPHP